MSGGALGRGPYEGCSFKVVGIWRGEEGTEKWWLGSVGQSGGERVAFIALVPDASAS